VCGFFLGGYCSIAEVSDAVAVGNLSWDTQEEDLSMFMSASGLVVSCEVQRHADTGRSKGWA